MGCLRTVMVADRRFEFSPFFVCIGVMKNVSRRAFVGTSLGAAGATLSAMAQEPESNWIDAHVHLWTSEWETYPISTNFLDHEPKPERFMPADLFAVQEGTGVKRTVLVQMSFYEYGNQFMLDVMSHFPGRFGGIGIVNHQLKNVKTTMTRMAEKGVRGFRLYAFPDRVKNWETHRGIATMWKTGAEEGLAMCCLSNPEVLPVIRKMCERFPDTPVVIDHFSRIGRSGNVEEEPLNNLLKLAEFPNVHVKTSAFYALGKKAPPYLDLLPMFQQVRDAFGAERLMWGSDCPYQLQGDHTYEASLDLVTKQADFLSEEEKQQILQVTAEKLFFS